MKTSKSPENTVITPSKKKLKQARLPFKLITDVSPKPDPPQPRKRKLSVPEAEPVTKVGKISKENDLSNDLVVISDDDSQDVSMPAKDDKTPNPLVKLVDNARKKKLQKAKAQKKSRTKSKKLQNGSADKAPVSDHEEYADVEMVEVEVIIHEERSGKSSPVVGNTGEESEKSSSGNVKSNDSGSLSSSKKTASDQSTKQEPKESTSSTCSDSSNLCDLKAETDHDSKDSINKTENKSHESANKLSEPENNLESKFDQINNVTPKRSTRNKAKSTVADVKSTSDDDVKSSLNKKPLSQSSDSQMSEKESSESADNVSQSLKVEKSDNTEQEGSVTQLENLKDQNNVTPKRSPRKKIKVDEKLNPNSSVLSSKLDDSVCSSPETPKNNKGINSPAVLANLTPKQLQKRLESAKKREEREKEKLEREKKRQEEKEERAKQKQEKEDQKRKEREDKEEARRREKEEKEEQKRKEREEKENERKQKEEEKRKEREKKEEQRMKEKEAREEERRKKQEALDLEKQEQELKKKKAAEAFANFFVPKQKTEKDQSVGPSKNSMLSSFTIKGDMRLAPTVRVDLSEEQREALDTFLMGQDSSTELYLACLKDGKVKPKSSGKTWPLSDKNDDDVMIVEDELPPLDGAGEVVTCEPPPHERLRPKLLSFHQNRRPPYWGTWRKRSKHVTPRRPFGQDEKLLDYEVDSDDDWEEEQEGESLDGSVCGSDEDGEPKDDYEVDNELFVPHGYLSDEEGTMDEDDVLSLTPETQKARLKHLEDEFESEMKKPTEKLKPRMYGLLWEDENGGKPDNCVDSLWNYFSKFAMIMDDPLPFLQPSKEPEETEKKKIKKKKVLADGEEASPKSEKKKKVQPENKEGRKTKAEPKKLLPNQPGINSFLFSKVKST